MISIQNGLLWLRSPLEGKNSGSQIKAADLYQTGKGGL